MSEPQAKIDISDLKETFLECPVCVEHFNQTDKRPRLLHSCLHAFCTQCLHQLLLKEGKGQITCPLCRQVQKISGNVDALSVDPVRNKLVDYVQMKNQKKVLCTDCPDGNDAESKCQECSLYLCKDCTYVHKRHRLTSDHSVLSLDEVFEQPLKSFTKGHFCRHHPKHHLEFYCDTDESLCCLSCTVLEHQGHKFQKVEEAVKIKQHDLETNLQNVRAEVKALKEKNQREEKRKADIKQDQLQAQTAAAKEFAKLERMTKDRKENVLRDIDTRSSTLLSSCEKNLAALEQTLAIMESTENYFSQAKANSDAVEMLEIYPSLQRSLRGSTAGDTPEEEVTVHHLKFEPSLIATAEMVLPEIGHIRDTSEPAAEDKDKAELAAFVNDVFKMAMMSRNKEELWAKLNKDNQKAEGKVNCSRCKSNTVKLHKIKCRHILCPGCFDTEFKQSEVCPVCKTNCKVITGDTPPGKMTTEIIQSRLRGYEGFGTIKIHYVIKDGFQNGRMHDEVDKTAYLPDTPEGQKVLALLKVAWDRRLTFEMKRNILNPFIRLLRFRIPHKTQGARSNSFSDMNVPDTEKYPDPNYLKRVQAKLAELGVTEYDL